MRGNCSIPECPKPAWARGWCRMHYSRWHLHGSPHFVLVKQTPAGVPEKFLASLLSYTGDKCKFWPYAKNNRGYAQISRDAMGRGKRYLVSRIICESVNGPAPTPTHQAAHSCGNGHLACVTPKHLRWATPVENAADMVRHGRSTRGVKCASAKLTEDQVAEVFRRASDGRETQAEIEKDFEIAQTLVSMIKLGKRWGWLTRHRE